SAAPENTDCQKMEEPRHISSKILPKSSGITKVSIILPATKNMRYEISDQLVISVSFITCHRGEILCLHSH
ncbi:hypothetical protein, partial [uncultured Bacteroides sp.]|uniref:hypothetical protein n=1 Tax=uncultured Bacteroides sp. TaxID=162156 RepID=UPI00262BAE54